MALLSTKSPFKRLVEHMLFYLSTKLRCGKPPSDYDALLDENLWGRFYDEMQEFSGLQSKPENTRRFTWRTTGPLSTDTRPLFSKSIVHNDPNAAALVFEHLASYHRLYYTQAPVAERWFSGRHFRYEAEFDLALTKLIPGSPQVLAIGAQGYCHSFEQIKNPFIYPLLAANDIPSVYLTLGGSCPWEPRVKDMGQYCDIRDDEDFIMAAEESTEMRNDKLLQSLFIDILKAIPQNINMNSDLYWMIGRDRQLWKEHRSAMELITGRTQADFEEHFRFRLWANALWPASQGSRRERPKLALNTCGMDTVAQQDRWQKKLILLRWKDEEYASICTDEAVSALVEVVFPGSPTTSVHGDMGSFSCYQTLHNGVPLEPQEIECVPYILSSQLTHSEMSIPNQIMHMIHTSEREIWGIIQGLPTRERKTYEHRFLNQLLDKLDDEVFRGNYLSCSIEKSHFCRAMFPIATFVFWSAAVGNSPDIQDSLNDVSYPDFWYKPVQCERRIELETTDSTFAIAGMALRGLDTEDFYKSRCAWKRPKMPLDWDPLKDTVMTQRFPITLHCGSENQVPMYMQHHIQGMDDDKVRILDEISGWNWFFDQLEGRIITNSQYMNPGPYHFRGDIPLQLYAPYYHRQLGSKTVFAEDWEHRAFMVPPSMNYIRPFRTLEPHMPENLFIYSCSPVVPYGHIQDTEEFLRHRLAHIRKTYQLDDDWGEGEKDLLLYLCIPKAFASVFRNAYSELRYFQRRMRDNNEV
ncbi:hypothetical protein HD806DRAFT_473172 [Xylariaceae sp. AK1471]|nr:hypothetical protein HD806DRAFT_473172 [Xylariaceae sp. AK1471]